MSDEITRFGAAIAPDEGASEEVDVDLDDTADLAAPVRPSAPAPASPKTEPKKARPRMSLRVPDDEVVRPQTSSRPVPSSPSLPPAARAPSFTSERNAADGVAGAAAPAPVETPPMRAVEAPPPPPAPPRPRASVTNEPARSDVMKAAPPLPPRPRAPSVTSEISGPPRPVARSVTSEAGAASPASAPSAASERKPDSVQSAPSVPPYFPPSAPTQVAAPPVALPVEDAPITPARIISVAPPPPDSSLEAPDDIPTMLDLPAIDSPRDSSDGIPIVEDVEDSSPPSPPLAAPTRSTDPVPGFASPAEGGAPRAEVNVAIAPTPVVVTPMRAPMLTIPESDGAIDIPVDEDTPADSASEREIASDDMLTVEAAPPSTRAPKAAVAAAPAPAASPPAAPAPVATAPITGPTPIAHPPAPPVGMSSDVHVADQLPNQTPPGGIAVHAPAPAPQKPVAAPPPPPRTAPKNGNGNGNGGAAAAKAPLVIVPPHASPLAPQPMTDAAANRKRTRPWWEELFNDDFIRTMAKITDAQIAREVDFIEDSLGVARGAMILDMACGTGRHSIELTKRGYRVVGLDLSLAMLAKAAEEAQERDQKLNFVQGDMREMTFEDMFDGVFCWNSSFGFFEEEKNAAVIQRVHRALRKGGQFVLDVINRDFAGQQAPSLVWFEGDGCICMDEMQIDWITSRMKVKRTMMMDDGRSREIEYSLRVYSLHELGKMLHDNGFRVAEVSGRTGTPGVFFGADSPNLHILAEKR